jgi:hypothetical protein
MLQEQDSIRYAEFCALDRSMAISEVPHNSSPEAAVT